MENELLSINYCSQKNILYATWNPETYEANNEEIKAEMLRYIDIIEQECPKYILVNEQNMFFIWTPTIQEWVDEYISSRAVVSSVRKIAVVQSEEIFIAVAAEQLMQESNSQKMEQNFFDSIEKAEEWLLD